MRKATASATTILFLTLAAACGSGGQEPSAGGGVKQSMLGAVSNPSGSGQVVTYDGWPLYTYTADTGPGKATGQAVNLDGGLWYVISPDGKVVEKKA